MPDEIRADITTTSDPKFVLQSRKLELDAEAKRRLHESETRRMELEAGWIGRIIGSPKHAPNNTAFLVLILSFITGIGVGFAFPNDRVEFWKTLIPILTLTLGYMFGKSSTS